MSNDCLSVDFLKVSAGLSHEKSRVIAVSCEVGKQSKKVKQDSPPMTLQFAVSEWSFNIACNCGLLSVVC